MEEPTNRELKIMLDNLCATMKDGFKGMHDRQDKTNGNVMKNTKFRWLTIGVIIFATSLGVVNVLGIFTEVFAK